MTWKILPQIHKTEYSNVQNCPNCDVNEKFELLLEMRDRINQYWRHHQNQCSACNNNVLWMGYPNLMPPGRRTENALNLGGRLLKSTFNAENFILRLSWSISSEFSTIYSWNVCRSLKSRKIHSRQNPYFWVQRCSRSSMLVDPEWPSGVLVMTSS